LAHAPDEIINTVLERGLESYTQYTIDKADMLIAELEKVRNQGYAIGSNETIDGITCIGAPVYDKQNNVVAAISISSASSRLTPDKYNLVIRLLQQKALLISQRLGHY
jgi:IclR family acetate operon transcriptional repressor